MAMDRKIEKKKWTWKRILAWSFGVIFLAFIIYLVFFRSHESRLRVEKDHLSVATVKQDKFQEYIPVDATVIPTKTVFLDAIQGGYVEKIFVEDGDTLSKGDTIIKLSNTDKELQYMEQESRMYDVINNLQNSRISLKQNKFTRKQELNNIEYQLDIAQKDFRRKQQFYKEGVISDKEFEDAQRTFKYLKKELELKRKLTELDSVATENQILQINNSIARIQKNLEMLEKSLSNLYITATIDGRLFSFSADIGETKRAGETIGQLDDLKGYKLEAEIDERYINRVYRSQQAEFDFRGKTYTLEIVKIYTDVTDGIFKADLSFVDEAPKNLKKGQTVQLKLKFSTPRQAMILKRGGFYQETGGNWVYVVDDSGEFAYKRDVRIGRQNTRYYEVLEGLKPGEKVIVSSYDNFGNKDKLILK